MRSRVENRMVVLMLAGALAGAPGAAACQRGADGAGEDPLGERVAEAAPAPARPCLRVGGYAALQYEDLREAGRRIGLSHLSLFVWWEGDTRLKFFSEFDLHGPYTVEADSDASAGRHLGVERAYFDYFVDDALTLRVGKYLTPVGRWNQVHADPLVWSTSRPLITSDIFPENASGVMATGNVPLLGRQADYAVYASVGQEWRPEPSRQSFHGVHGARLNVPLDKNWQLGLSYAAFEQGQARRSRMRLAGLDFLWSSNGYELSGEALRLSGTGPAGSALSGGFIQGVAPLFGALSGVARIETVRAAQSGGARRHAALGLHYRRGAVAYKAELVRGDVPFLNAPVGLLSSVSVLF